VRRDCAARVNQLIVCAHPDDELLGAYELLAGAAVVYATVPSSPAMAAAGRYAEAAALCAATGAATHGVVDLAAYTPAVPPSCVWVPDATDTHPEHRMAQAQGIALAHRLQARVGWYSIEKRAGYCRPRSPEQRDAVYRLFQKHYPTQARDYSHAPGWLFDGATALAPASFTFHITAPHGAGFEVLEVTVGSALLLRTFMPMLIAKPNQRWESAESLALYLRAAAAVLDSREQVAPITVRRLLGTHTEGVTL
jgi:hypothetical protein